MGSNSILHSFSAKSMRFLGERHWLDWMRPPPHRHFRLIKGMEGRAEGYVSSAET